MYEDEELEEIRRRKLAQIQDQETVRAQEEQRAALDAQKQAILSQILNEEARQRLANIRLVRPQLAEAVELRLIQLAQQGSIKEKLNDNQLKDILRKIQGQKRDTKVDVRRL